jgi:nitrogenase iron protein NifH
VLQVGCDPKHDSCYQLVSQREIRTVLGQLDRAGGRPLTRADVIMRGRTGVDCIETGGPEAGVGCAGRGITKMFEVLRELDLFSGQYDRVLFDVLGDVVCGGFAAPLRLGYAREVYIVVSGEIMAMWAANNIAHAVARHQRNAVALAGLVPNLRNVPGELKTLEHFAAALSAPLLPAIPRDNDNSLAEREAQTVVEFAPASAAAAAYRRLGERIEALTPADCVVPTPLGDRAFEQFLVDSHLRSRV